MTYKRGSIITASFILLAIVFFAFLIFFIPSTRSYTGSGAGPFNCSTNCSDCNAAIGNASAGAIVYLTSSLAGNNLTCIDFGAKSNVIFDCQNFSNYIAGNSSCSSLSCAGINLTSVNGNTVRNCNVSLFYNGIFLSAASNNIFINITSNNNSQSGINLYSASNNNTLSNITANNESSYGIYLQSFGAQQPMNNVLSNISSKYTSIGISISTGSGNNLTTAMFYNESTAINLGTNSNYNNIIDINSTNCGLGVDAGAASNNTITNMISNKGQYGIRLSGSSSNNTLVNITANNNTVYGMFINAQSNNNLIMNSTTNNNSDDGIYITDSHNNTFMNIITNNNTNYGILTLLSCNNSVFKNIIAAYDTTAGFGLLVGLNNTLINVTGINSTKGVALSGVNNTLINITAFGNYYGLYLDTANNNTITNVMSYNNSADGVYLSGTAVTNNIFTNIVSINNSRYGIYSDINSNKSFFTNVTANYNLRGGIYVITSVNNNFTLINASYNTGFGMLLYITNNSKISSLIAQNNSLYGIALQSGSYNNNITGSFIQYNTVSGILLNSTTIAPKNNLFYNNYFNNSAQYSNVSAPSTNFFNTTKTLGTNIVGGSYLGGNYWAALNASGFSQTCSASTDGICDTSYNIDGTNYDYLPLTCIENWTCSAWGSCQPGGIQTRTCTDANLCQTYKYQSLYPLTQSCFFFGGEQQQNQGASQSQNFATITPSQPAVMNVNNAGLELTKIQVSTKRVVTGASLTVTSVNVSSSNLLIGLPIGSVYQAFEIVHPNLTDTNVANATVTFKVNKTWVQQQNSSPSSIKLYRMPNGSTSWTPVTTTLTRTDAQYYYYSAVSPGFSTFLIYIDKSACTPTEKRCYSRDVQMCLGNGTWLLTERCSYYCSNGECVNEIAGIPISFAVYGMAIAIGAAVIVAVITGVRRARKNK